MLTLSYMKKLLKKINKKKKMDDYNHLIDNISLKWNNIFDIKENNIILKLPKK